MKDVSILLPKITLISTLTIRKEIIPISDTCLKFCMLIAKLNFFLHYVLLRNFCGRKPVLARLLTSFLIRLRRPRPTKT